MDRIFSKKRVKKRAISLLEVGIALFLTSILLTVVLRIFFQLPKIEKNVENTKHSYYPAEYTQAKLQSVFSKTIPKKNLPKHLKQHNPLELYETGEKHPSIFVIFDNGIDPDNKYRGEVIGRIYLDFEKNLSLTIWPSDANKEDYRKDILLKNVKSFEWEFFNPTYSPIGTEKLSPQWENTWTDSNLPPMIKLAILFEDGKSEKFHFFPSSGFAMITYQ